ncbi:CorA metal ion transporter [Spiromyces aspiralis]|uniref:CorA metal ion transporter n=1 Tax=Spiromyces aspiralis TaxID=68401 RepID=A0ACC1HNU4_9FUNG|nr:CorA metal ion transporter [Spiromyces aspiralis]
MSGSIYHCERILSRANLNYMTRVNLEMTNSIHETNDVVVKLTAVTVVFLPLNLVAGLWGMNVTVPGIASQNPGVRNFFIILGSMVVYAIVCVLVLRRVKF